MTFKYVLVPEIKQAIYKVYWMNQWKDELMSLLKIIKKSNSFKKKYKYNWATMIFKILNFKFATVYTWQLVPKKTYFSTTNMLTLFCKNESSPKTLALDTEEWIWHILYSLPL